MTSLQRSGFWGQRASTELVAISGLSSTPSSILERVSILLDLGTSGAPTGLVHLSQLLTLDSDGISTRPVAPPVDPVQSALETGFDVENEWDILERLTLANGTP